MIHIIKYKYVFIYFITYYNDILNVLYIIFSHIIIYGLPWWPRW